MAMGPVPTAKSGRSCVPFNQHLRLKNEIALKSLRFAFSWKCRMPAGGGGRGEAGSCLLCRHGWRGQLCPRPL